MTGLAPSLVGSLAIAAVSTFGDLVWANWIPGHLAVYGFVHGALLFLCIGLFLGILEDKPAFGAFAGTLVGALGATSFYLLAPPTGRWIMVVIWIALWVALGVLNGFLSRRPIELRSALARGVLAAAGSGAAFYAISGIWFPFNPRGWDYAVHFGAWTIAYLPGFAALLIARR